MPTASAVNADILLNHQATEWVNGNLGPKSSLAFLTMQANGGHLYYSFCEVSGDRTNQEWRQQHWLNEEALMSGMMGGCLRQGRQSRRHILLSGEDKLHGAEQFSQVRAFQHIS